MLILLLFLVCLNTGIGSMMFFTYREQTDTAQTTAQIELLLLTQAFEQDYYEMDERVRDEGALMLMKAYGEYYKPNGISLLFTEGDTQLYNTFDEAVDRPSTGKLAVRKVGTRHVLVTYELCDSKYLLTYGKDLAALDVDFQNMLTVVLLTDLGVSLVLAIGLFWLLRRLTQPLQKLRETTEVIAAGNYDCTVEQKGSDEFAALAGSFNAMVSQIRSQMQSLELSAYQNQMLVDNLAHELRTPMTSIRGYAEYIMEAPLDEEETIEAASVILSEAERLGRISEKLLDSAFIRHNGIKRAELVTEPLLTSVCEKLARKAGDRGVTLSVAQITPDTPALISGDAVLLDLLLYNLTDNAIKACEAGGRVLIGCQRGEDAVCLYVSDNGKGMTAEQIRHITEPFYRTDKSRSRADGGAGLGLSLCRRIVDAHGGEMTFDSELGKGTTVSVRLSEKNEKN